MEGEHVDRTPLPKMCVGRLDPHKPSRGPENLQHAPHEGRMALVNQAIERSTAPPDTELQPRVDPRHDSPERGNRHAVQVPALHS
jgi:hypothetical protein